MLRWHSWIWFKSSIPVGWTFINAWVLYMVVLTYLKFWLLCQVKQPYFGWGRALLLVLHVTDTVISFVICESIFATFISDSSWNTSLQVFELNAVLHLKLFVSHTWKEISCSYHDILMGQNLYWQINSSRNVLPNYCQCWLSQIHCTL
jgi:hypothetical protein